MSAPHNQLYHCMGHTYGTWLPGDARGFRSRHHRIHCEGDYKNPPLAGAFADLYRRSKDLMKRDPVFLTSEQRDIAIEAFVTSLVKRDIDVRIGGIDRIHFHILAPFGDHNPRHWIGIAKKESSHALKLAGCGIDGGIWAVRCKCLPVEDAAHEKYTLDYIADHANRGAAVWERPTKAATVSSTMDQQTVEELWVMKRGRSPGT